MDIYLSEMSVGNNFINLSDNVINFSDCNFDKCRLKITVYHQDGSVWSWSAGAQLHDRAVFTLACPENTDIKTVSGLKSYTGGMFAKYLGCTGNNIDSFISPGVDRVVDRFSKKSLSSWMDSTGNEYTLKLKALVIDFLWGFVSVYPEIRILRTPSKEQDAEFEIYFKPTVDPFFTIGLSYSMAYPSVKMSATGEDYQLLWLPDVA